MRATRLAVSLLALATFAGCVSTSLVPVAGDWTAQGDRELAWHERDAEVVVGASSKGEVEGRIRNRGTTALRFRFLDVLPAGTGAAAQRGTVTREGSWFLGTWNRPLEIGVWFDLPGIEEERESDLSFTLTPVEGVAHEDGGTVEALRYDLEIRSSDWSTTCPLHFDVHRRQPGALAKIFIGIAALAAAALFAAALFVGVVLGVFAAFAGA